MGIVFWFFIACWFLMLLRSAYHGSGIKTLRDLPFTEPDHYPLLSILVAARNEAHTIGESLPKLLAVDYPNIEFILVDDRSTDRTGEIIDQFASQDARVHPVHVTTLPEGWLGKVNALKTGESIAKGEWLLFTDADIHFRQQVLKRSVAYAMLEGIDHYMLIPDRMRKAGDFLLQVVNICFGIFFVQAIRARKLRTPDKRAFAGVGAFNLVKRSTFERAGGFEHLKLEVLDDVGVGKIIKENGGTLEVQSGTGLLDFDWYPNISQMVKGLEKNSFAGFARFRVGRAVFLLVGLLAVILGPLILALCLKSAMLLIVYAALYFILPFIVAAFLERIVHVAPLQMSMLPVGFLVLWYALFLSTLKAWQNGGIYWRDTFYPLDKLRQGQVVKL